LLTKKPRHFIIFINDCDKIELTLKDRMLKDHPKLKARIKRYFKAINCLKNGYDFLAYYSICMILSGLMFIIFGFLCLLSPYSIIGFQLIVIGFMLLGILMFTFLLPLLLECSEILWENNVRP